MNLYSGKIGLLTCRVPIELLDGLNAKARTFDMMRSEFLRVIIEMAVLIPEQYRTRRRRENAICDLIRSGADPTKDREATWNPDHMHNKGEQTHE